MDPATKDIIDVGAKVAGALGIVFSAIGLNRTAKIRREDLRWRKAAGAHEALSDIHKSPYGVEAIHMMDSIASKDPYTSPTALCDLSCVSHTDLNSVIAGLEVSTITASQRAYVRRCFDWFLYYLDRVAYHTAVGMLETGDFDAPLEPYARFIVDRWPCFGPLANRAGYRHVGAQVARLAKKDLPSIA